MLYVGIAMAVKTLLMVFHMAMVALRVMAVPHISVMVVPATPASFDVNHRHRHRHSHTVRYEHHHHRNPNGELPRHLCATDTPLSWYGRKQEKHQESETEDPWHESRRSQAWKHMKDRRNKTKETMERSCRKKKEKTRDENRKGNTSMPWICFLLTWGEQRMNRSARSSVCVDC
jgi:2-polyprenyl-6-methoxyphenol hydroxylase-like FAD-dependent oxidoreductase